MGINMKLIFSFVLILGLMTCPVYAEIPGEYINVFSKIYSTRHGLPSNHVNGINQDKKGQIWITTQNGIASYNGITFTTYKSRIQQSESIYYYCIHDDSRDRVWVGTSDGAAFLDEHHKESGDQGSI